MDAGELERRTGVPREIWEALLNPEAQLPREEDLPPAGSRITLSEAARRYAIPQPTLNRWALRGYIRTLEEPKAPGAPRYVDEHDVASVVGAYRMEPGQGKRTVRLNVATA